MREIPSYAQELPGQGLRQYQVLSDDKAPCRQVCRVKTRRDLCPKRSRSVCEALQVYRRVWKTTAMAKLALALAAVLLLVGSTVGERSPSPYSRGVGALK